MLAQHWLMSKAICFNNWPPFSPHLVINTALLLSLTFCKINRSEAPSSLFISFQIIHSIFDFWSFPRKIFAIFGEEMFNFMKSWKVTFFLWWRRWWCTKTVSSRLLLMRLALPCISGGILLRCQRRIISSAGWQRCPDQAGAGFPRMQLRLRHLARFLLACTLCINSEKAWLVLLSVQRFCAVCKTFARLIMIV